MAEIDYVKLLFNNTFPVLQKRYPVSMDGKNSDDARKVNHLSVITVNVSTLNVFSEITKEIRRKCGIDGCFSIDGPLSDGSPSDLKKFLSTILSDILGSKNFVALTITSGILGNTLGYVALVGGSNAYVVIPQLTKE